ncbi:MAG TPA: phospho-sugar mutase [Micromonosporaceae bacterium]
MADLRARAEAWLADDPDPASRAELRTLINELPATEAELADRFSGPLHFGTAGLRGRLRAGPNGMNRAVVRAAAAGLVRWLDARGAPGPVVIGYDARHGSRQFAEETARVTSGAGRRALLLHRPLPTPVLAYAVRALEAVAGVMVTASHNPPADNGYKVYLGAALGDPKGTGAQIVTPADAEISAAIAAVGRLADVPLGDVPVDEVLTDAVVDNYLNRAAVVVSATTPRALKVAYTPLHGVGGGLLRDLLARAGFAHPAVVPEQADPDPDFPTLPFPNPEEPGAMDRVIRLAGKTGADLAIANDPDADRCAVAVPDQTGGHDSSGWRVLRGDELGVLLADHLIRRGTTGMFVTTIVSSSLLRSLCAARGVPYGETLTGFKWIVRATAEADPDDPPLAYGYEEAIGYCVAPDQVRDKDGMTAALLVCELAASLKAAGRGLSDRLDELAREFGVYATDQLSVRVADLARIPEMLARLRERPPRTLLGQPVDEVRDLLPATDAVLVRTPAARMVVRPSGTEPKLKAYLEVIEPVTGGDVRQARVRAAAGLAALRGETAAALGVASG